MKAAAVFGIKDIRLVKVSDPVCEPDGVIIKVKACGICGSDMHVYNSGLLLEDSTKEIDRYRIIGHEFTGEIIEVGEDVKSFKIGDRVASVHNKGGMAEYNEVHGKRLNNLYKIPENLDYFTTATLEPFCNPVHSFHLKEPKDSDTVAIFGSGVIGLGYLQIVKAHTKAKTIITDISDFRLNIAKQIGANIIINAKHEDPVKKIKEITGDHYVRYQKKSAGGCDIAVDCAGIPLTFGQTMEVLQPDYGTAIIAAIYEEDVRVDPSMIIFKYMEILGSMGYYPNETEEALNLIASEKVNRDILITHKIGIDDVAKAFKTQGNAAESIKVMVIPF